MTNNVFVFSITVSAVIDVLMFSSTSYRAMHSVCAPFEKERAGSIRLEYTEWHAYSFAERVGHILI